MNNYVSKNESPIDLKRSNIDCHINI